MSRAKWDCVTLSEIKRLTLLQCEALKANNLALAMEYKKQIDELNFN